MHIHFHCNPESNDDLTERKKRKNIWNFHPRAAFGGQTIKVTHDCDHDDNHNHSDDDHDAGDNHNHTVDDHDAGDNHSGENEEDDSVDNDDEEKTIVSSLSGTWEAFEYVTSSEHCW